MSLPKQQNNSVKDETGMTRLQIPDEFRTSRLRLRKPVPEDAERIYNGYACDDVARHYMNFSKPESLDRIRAVVENWIEQWDTSNRREWVVELANTGLFLGVIGATIEDFRAEIGYILCRKFWGNGYIPEAAESLISHLFRQPGFYRVSAYCDAENKQSYRAMEKMGMQREGMLRRFCIYPNICDSPRDCYLYAIVKV